MKIRCEQGGEHESCDRCSYIFPARSSDGHIDEGWVVFLPHMTDSVRLCRGCTEALSDLVTKWAAPDMPKTS